MLASIDSNVSNVGAKEAGRSWRGLDDGHAKSPPVCDMFVAD